MDAGLIIVERNGDFYLRIQPEKARRVRGPPPAGARSLQRHSRQTL
jgi:hypothetical protein